MDALVEAHDEAEVRRAVALGAPIDRHQQSRPADARGRSRHHRAARAAGAGATGCSSPNRASRAAPTSSGWRRYADAFLVGSSLMRAGDPAQAARALAFGRVKVCGLTDADDVDAGRARAAPAYAGLVMVPGTPRAVTPDAGRAARRRGARGGAASVGVFRNEKLMQVARGGAARSASTRSSSMARRMPPISARLRSLLPEAIEIWAAGAVGARCAGAAARRRPDPVRHQGRRPTGGTGIAFDWARVARPAASWRAALLAGGLNPDNAARGRAGRRLGARRRLGRRGGAGPQGSGASSRAFFEALRPPARGEARHADDRPLRRLWRRLCARNPDAGARAARGGLPRRAGGRRLSRPSSPTCSPNMPGGRRR